MVGFLKLKRKRLGHICFPAARFDESLCGCDGFSALANERRLRFSERYARISRCRVNPSDSLYLFTASKPKTLCHSLLFIMKSTQSNIEEVILCETTQVLDRAYDEK